jgi:hypothetical protein
MASIKRQISDSEKLEVLAKQRRNGILFCFVDDHPIEAETDVEFHHIKPFSEDGPTEIANNRQVSAWTSRAAAYPEGSG